MQLSQSDILMILALIINRLKYISQSAPERAELSDLLKRLSAELRAD